MLDQDGTPPGEALKRFLNAVGDRDLMSDEPDFDAHWLGMLAEAARMSPDRRTIGDARKLAEQKGSVLNSASRLFIGRKLTTAKDGQRRA
jgi:hypothetical protein